MFLPQPLTKSIFFDFSVECPLADAQHTGRLFTIALIQGETLPYAFPLYVLKLHSCQLPDPEVYSLTPSLVRLPSGRILCSFALLTRVNRLPGRPDHELKTLLGQR